jgi:hypothetical protein
MDKTNTPEIVYGFNISTEYKRFSLFANFSGQSKSWQFLQKLATLDQNTLQDIIENRYTPGSLDSKYPILPTSDAFVEVSGLRSDFWLQDASFVRLKTLEIGYVLPESILSKAGINSMRLYLNGNNLFTIDKLKWYDPEGSQEAGDFYPQSKIYNIGLSLTF